MWVKNFFDLDVTPSSRIAEWMQQSQNIGAALREVCRKVELILVNQGVDKLFSEEYEALSLPVSEEPGFVRKIFLEGDGELCTYGRVVMSNNTYKNYEGNFNSLGKQLIGETLLYNNPNVVRSQFEFARLQKMHPLFDEIICSVKEISPEFFWARRSVFWLNQLDNLLITEVFLPSIPRGNFRCRR